MIGIFVIFLASQDFLFQDMLLRVQDIKTDKKIIDIGIEDSIVWLYFVAEMKPKLSQIYTWLTMYERLFVSSGLQSKKEMVVVFSSYSDVIFIYDFM